MSETQQVIMPQMGVACREKDETALITLMSVALQQISETKSCILRDLQDTQGLLQKEASEAKLEAMKSGFESQKETLKAISEISNRQVEVERSLEAKIIEGTRTILAQLNADKLDAKNDEIQQLRFEKRNLEQANLFAPVYTMLNSLQSANKAVNFGSGTITQTPVSTNTSNNG